MKLKLHYSIKSSISLCGKSFSKKSNEVSYEICFTLCINFHINVLFASVTVASELFFDIQCFFRKVTNCDIDGLYKSTILWVTFKVPLPIHPEKRKYKYNAGPLMNRLIWGVGDPIMLIAQYL